MFRYSLLPLSVLMLSGCHSYSIYKPAIAIDPVGYTSGKTKDQRYYVTMSGEADTPKHQVYTYAFRRALEIADENGAEAIEVIGAFDQQGRDDLSLFFLRNGLGGLNARDAGGTFGRRGPIFQRPYQLALEFRLIETRGDYVSREGVVVDAETALQDIALKIASEPIEWDN